MHRDFLSQFPKPLPRDPDSTFRQWVDAHQDEFDAYEQDIEAVIESHRIMDAEGDDLDEIGESYGILGRRRGRGDTEYRQLLMSVVNSFAGRGTPRGMKIAIASGVHAKPEDIDIIEHFDDNAYDVVVGQWIRNRPSTIHELADLSDPSGVYMKNAVTYAYDDAAVGASADNVVAGTVISIPDGDVGVHASDVSVTISRAGSGAGRFDGLDPFGEGVSIGEPGPDSGDDSYGQGSYGQAPDTSTSSTSSTTDTDTDSDSDDDETDS